MKNFRIDPVPSSSLVSIAFEGGGEVPDVLKGHYTTPAAAKIAIEVWKAAHPERDEVEVTVAREEEEKAAQERVARK
jgi:hypothetical protein